MNKNEISQAPRLRLVVVMLEQPLSIVLRASSQLPTGLAPAGPLRDRQDEKRQALEKATAKALASVGTLQTYDRVAMQKGAATALNLSINDQKVLSVVPRLSGNLAESTSARKARLAAMKLWHKGKATTPTPMALTPQLAEGTRYIRRGEFELMPVSYRPYDSFELLAIVRQVQNKDIKWA